MSDDTISIRPPDGVARLAAMLVASLCLHAGLVGVAAFIPRGLFDRAPQKEELLDLGVDIQLGEAAQELIVAEDAPPPDPIVTPPPPEPPPPPPEPPPPPPEEIPPPPEPPPPMAEPDFVEPEPPPPPREQPKPERPPTPKPLPKPRTEPPPANARRGPVAQEGVVGGNVARSENTTGTPGGQKVSNTGWKTPKAPYPFAAKKMRLQGVVSLRVRTDAAGRIASAEIVRAAHPMLDSYSVRFAKGTWSGPPNSTRTVEVEFNLLGGQR